MVFPTLNSNFSMQQTHAYGMKESMVQKKLERKLGKRYLIRHEAKGRPAIARRTTHDLSLLGLCVNSNMNWNYKKKRLLHLIQVNPLALLLRKKEWIGLLLPFGLSMLLENKQQGKQIYFKFLTAKLERTEMACGLGFGPCVGRKPKPNLVSLAYEEWTSDGHRVMGSSLVLWFFPSLYDVFIN